MHLKSAVDNLVTCCGSTRRRGRGRSRGVREAAHANDLLKVTRLLQLLRDVGRAPESQPFRLSRE